VLGLNSSTGIALAVGAVTLTCTIVRSPISITDESALAVTLKLAAADAVKVDKAKTEAMMQERKEAICEFIIAVLFRRLDINEFREF
jgi:hypothetical protein